VAAQIGIARTGGRHSAFEDAWLVMMVYLWLHGCPVRLPFSVFGDAHPTNLRPVPPVPAGPLPRRKKVVAFAPDVEQQATSRLFDDHELQVAWELFERKEYKSALARALAAVTRDEARGASASDSLPYEIACMILRRESRLMEEKELLWRYFRRVLGRDATTEQVVALSVQVWHPGTAQALYANLHAKNDAGLHTHGRHPSPAMWEMAARFVRVTERIEKPRETNEQRLVRALMGLPNEAAFLEVAICIRKNIVERAKRGDDTDDELLRLHRLAQQHAFFYGMYRLGWDHPENKADARVGLYPHVGAAMATASDLEAILLPYQEIGYEHLPLLNKTDAGRLTAAFGDPAGHAVPRERHKRIWERYRRESRRAKR
jgi:hypothetical protein